MNEYCICLVDSDENYLKSFKKYIKLNFTKFEFYTFNDYCSFKKNYDSKKIFFDLVIVSEEFAEKFKDNKSDRYIVLKTTEKLHDSYINYIDKYQSIENIINEVSKILDKRRLKTKEIDNLIKYINKKFTFDKDLSDSEVSKVIRREIDVKLKNFKISEKEKNKIKKQLFNAVRRLDIIQPLLEDEKIDEIMINGYDSIYIETDGKILKTDYCFEDKSKLDNLIANIVGKVNREINESFPIVDARLSNGSRVNIVLNPVALNGPIVTIRKFKNSVLSIGDLIKNKTIDYKIADFFERIIRNRLNIIISGGTASGKTTLLNIISNYIDKHERIITIEDSAELNIKNIDNLVRLETKNTNSVNAKDISVRDLIKNALRMRPDRIIVGEVRGEESIDMLQAMNTGHNGSLSTAHANSCCDMLTRLETMVLLGNDIPLEAIRRQIFSALDIIIHLTKLRDGSRKVVEISEVSNFEKGNIVLNKIYDYSSDSFASESNLKLNGFKLKEKHVYY